MLSCSQVPTTRASSQTSHVLKFEDSELVLMFDQCRSYTELEMKQTTPLVTWNELKMCGTDLKPIENPKVEISLWSADLKDLVV